MRISGPLTGPSSYGKLLTTFLLALGLAFMIAACGGPSDEPSFHGGGSVDQHALPAPPHHGAGTASVEERVYYSDVVVRASLQSAADGQLRFKAIEYLKGTGSAQFVVRASTVGRDTTWDDREAVLFLSVTEAGASGADAAAPQEFRFIETTDEDYTGDLRTGYSVDSRNPVWIPAEAERAANGTVGDASTTLITDGTSVSGDSPPTISLADLRSTIAWVAGGDGVEGYDQCVRQAISLEREMRGWETYYGREWTPSQFPERTYSGASAGTVLYDIKGDDRDEKYVKSWLTGQDAGLFRIRIVDDDTMASTGYKRTVTIARPLPAGSYRFIHNTLWQVYFPCDYTPPNWSGVEALVTVTAPAGTVHEAFFDPVTVGTAVGADGSNGVLKPTEFTVGGTATTMQGLKWENGSLVLTLSPHSPLTGNSLDFIALDGLVAFSLHSNDATADSAAGTLTWAVAAAPWQAGDRLMLRIREAEASAVGSTP